MQRQLDVLRVRSIAYSRCLTGNEIFGTNTACAPPTITFDDGFDGNAPDQGPGAPAPAAPAITPAQAGAIAVARLQLPLNPPGIGPSPSVNKWKMAAVGYPLWLWSDGPTRLGPVGQTVAGLSVSLRAQVNRTVVRMGDGSSIRCSGSGTPYRDSVTPGSPSPSCGYAYRKPSLPGGDYTVTAVTYWDVTWTAAGQSGVIVVPREGTAQLPVGELQSLVR